MAEFNSKPQNCRSPQRSVFKASLDRFMADESGVAAVEFAMVATPYFLIVLLITEMGVSFVAKKALSVAVDEIARDIKTGVFAVDTPDPDVDGDEDRVEQEAKERFRTQLCESSFVEMMFKCNKLLIDVQTIASWADAPENPETEEVEIAGQTVEQFSEDDFGFKPGGRQTINIVRVFYEWPSFIPIDIAKSKSDNWVNGKRLMGVTTAFLSEPF